jgi:hypothetical protein
MKKVFKIVGRIILYVLAFILPITALAAIGYQSTVGLASKPSHWAVVPIADGGPCAPKPLIPQNQR